MRPFDLTGRVAVVTGGATGIGLGFASGLASAGASVAVLGRRPRALKEAADHLGSLGGGEVLPLQCDVSDESQVEKALGSLVDRLGRLDACFANAGAPASRTRPFTDMTTDEWREQIGANLDATMFTLRAAARILVDQGTGGSLVVTSSIGALSGFPYNEHYAAAKAGVIALARGLAVELGRHQIRSNAIVPGLVRTAMTEGNEEHLDAHLLPRVPLRRWGAPEDYAGVAVYLASDASRFHTGDVLTVDGGFSVF